MVHFGLTASVPLYFNGFFLGDLLSTSTVADFTIPESLLALSNSVRIDNLSSTSFTLIAKVFQTGDVGDWESGPSLRRHRWRWSLRGAWGFSPAFGGAAEIRRV
jgi:hypothetical protein